MWFLGFCTACSVFNIFITTGPFSNQFLFSQYFSCFPDERGQRQPAEGWQIQPQQQSIFSSIIFTHVHSGPAEQFLTPIKKNRGHRSRFMAKRQHKWQFWLQMIIYEKGPGRFSRSARSQPRGVIVIVAINQLEYKKDLCCLSLGDWTKLPPHFMCQCYEQQVMRSAVLTSY